MELWKYYSLSTVNRLRTPILLYKMYETILKVFKVLQCHWYVERTATTEFWYSDL